MHGVDKFNNYAWFAEGQNFTVSCKATDVNVSCIEFHWEFFKTFDEGPQLTPTISTQSNISGRYGR